MLDYAKRTLSSDPDMCKLNFEEAKERLAKETNFKFDLEPAEVQGPFDLDLSNTNGNT